MFPLLFYLVITIQKHQLLANEDETENIMLNDCINTLNEITDCLPKTEKPTTCSGMYNGNFKCADDVITQTQCDIDVVKQKIYRIREVIETSDDLICKKDIFGKNEDCLLGATVILSTFSNIVDGMTTSNICDFKKFQLNVTIEESEGECRDNLTMYANELYAASPCGKIPINSMINSTGASNFNLNAMIALSIFLIPFFPIYKISYLC